MNKSKLDIEFLELVQFLHIHFPLFELYEYKLGKVEIYFSAN